MHVLLPVHQGLQADGDLVFSLQSHLLVVLGSAVLLLFSVAHLGVLSLDFGRLGELRLLSVQEVEVAGRVSYFFGLLL